jgi:peroxiredoxin
MRDMLKPGEKAPAFELESLDGTRTSLADLQGGKPIVVAFFKVSCPTCQYTFPFLDRIGHTAELPVVAISQDDAAATRKFNTSLGVTLPTLLDKASENYPASNGFQITHVPSMFLVEPGGLITWAVMGFHKQALADLGERIGVEPFRPGEKVVEVRGG